ncbi:uncharacterized protein [Triticum aestivum]|uniref:uncharacterized protein isoform X3 n=1 Tax=Triticum aestivum TaxID=4565 RepID=UPI001D033273|nr:uncharacterized protein LOC123068739 isoform X3 [Triticum aestivum]
MGRRRLDFCSRSALRRRRPSPSLASWSCPFPSSICSPRRRLPPRTIPSRSAATPSLEQPLPPNPKPPAGATPQHAPSLLFLGTGLWSRRSLPLSPSSSRSNGLVHKSGSTSRSSLFRRVIAFLTGAPDYEDGQLDTKRYGEQYASKGEDVDLMLLPEQIPSYRDPVHSKKLVLNSPPAPRPRPDGRKAD